MRTATRRRLGKINLAVMDEANAILRTFGDDLHFELPTFQLRVVSSHGSMLTSQLRIVSKYGSMPARLSDTGADLRHPYYKLGLSGTGARATGQIIRWVRGMTRYPLIVWKYWCSPVIGLGTNMTYNLIAASSYRDDILTACVCCGRHPKGIDWYSLDGIEGPCCTFANCERSKTRS